MGDRRLRSPRLVEAVVVGGVRAGGADEVGVVVQPGRAAVLADDGGDDVESVGLVAQGGPPADGLVVVRLDEGGVDDHNIGLGMGGMERSQCSPSRCGHWPPASTV